MLAVETTLRRGGWVVAETPARTVVRLKQLVSLSMPYRLTVFPVQPGLLQLPERKVYISFPFCHRSIIEWQFCVFYPSVMALTSLISLALLLCHIEKLPAQVYSSILCPTRAFWAVIERLWPMQNIKFRCPKVVRWTNVLPHT